MPLEVACPSCSGQFRVPDSAAGKRIRCPKCKGAMDVPAASVESQPAPPQPKTQPKPKPEMWFLRSEEGEDYGPVAHGELDSWRAEGRITVDCQLLREGTDQWQWAGDVYPELNEGAVDAPALSSTAKSKRTTFEKSRELPAASDNSLLSTRSRLVAGLLGIFLGPLGTHRFYLGYWVIGLVMLATGGGCGIWSLVDAILVLIGKVPDADGRRLA